MEIYVLISELSLIPWVVLEPVALRRWEEPLPLHDLARPPSKSIKISASVTPLSKIEDRAAKIKSCWNPTFVLEPLFKKWKKTWMVVSLGGNLKCFASKRSSRTQKTYNLKMDLVAFKTGKQVS